MLDIGWSELAVVAVLALLVIGPKDLPAVMRTVGKWTQKARSVSREFQSSVDEMIREAELEDARKALDSAKNLNVQNAIENTIDPTGEVKESARELDREARREEPGEAKADDGKAGDGKTGDDKAAAETKAGDTPAAAETAESGGGAKVIKHPVKIAPPHSITPPAEEPASTQTASAPPEAEAPAGEKSASGGGAA